MILRSIYSSTECMVVANDPTVKVRYLEMESKSISCIELPYSPLKGWIVLSNHRYGRKTSKKCSHANTDTVVKKHLRAQEVAKENNLPCIYLGKYKKSMLITETDGYTGI